MSDEAPMKRVKRRDRYAIVATCRNEDGSPVDLSGTSAVRWLNRVQHTSGFSVLVSEKLPGTGGEVKHILDGTLAPAVYENEIEATWEGENEGDPPTIITFPTNQNGEPRYLLFEVQPDIG